MTQEIPPRVQRLLDAAMPDDVRFIKLGKKSIWWPLARQTNTLRIGFRQFDFALCHSGDWVKARRAFTATGARSGKGDITRAVNQVKDFFELPEKTLWFTIEDGDIWWCFAETKVTDLYSGDDVAEADTGARQRDVIDCWRNVDINGERLRLDSMTTKITKVASFQETIAKPSGAADLLRRIRRLQSDVHARATKARDETVVAVGDLLDQLHQDDFELLVELIFSASGWKRVSAVGGTQKMLDFAVTLPTTGEYAFIQVKSQTNAKTFQEMIRALEAAQGYSRMFFAYHSPKAPFEAEVPDRVTVWHRYDIARQVIRAGLVDWVLARTS